MVSFITKTGQKIDMRKHGEFYLLTVVFPNGQSEQIELSFENITALSIMINSLILDNTNEN
jgi:hypothetical protein